jgi:hypothetical protein
LTRCRRRARRAAAGGSATVQGSALAELDAQMLALNASPGGAADLLAATLFLDRVAARSCIQRMLWNRLHCHSCQPRPQRQSAGRGCRSGDMEVLFTAAGDTLNIDITTSVDNSRRRWNALFDRLNLINGLPAGS